jgi:hypothetical protein
MKKAGWFYLLLFLSSTVWADDLIINGDFSSPTPTTGGIYAWVTYTVPMGGTSYQPKLNFTPVAGTPGVSVTPPCAMLGNSTPFTGSAYLEQTINVPRDALGNSISFYYQWQVNALPNGFYDWAEGWLGNIFLFGEKPRYVYDPYGTPTEVVPFGSPVPTPTPGWQQVQHWVPLENYGGQSLILRFLAVISYGTGETNALYIDNCSLPCTTATKTATPTMSPTFTITKTSTITLTPTPTPTITVTFTITPTITKTLTITPVVIPAGEITAYPNPAMGSVINFMYSPTAVSNVKIDIYNLAGMKVAHLEDKNKGTTNNQVTSWNIQNVASGVYLYTLSLEGADGTMTTTKMKKVVISK